MLRVAEECRLQHGENDTEDDQKDQGAVAAGDGQSTSTFFWCLELRILGDQIVSSLYVAAFSLDVFALRRAIAHHAFRRGFARGPRCRLTWPSAMQTTRSLMASSSGSSDEIMMMLTPAWTSWCIRL